jgi:hypothetical protein
MKPTLQGVALAICLIATPIVTATAQDARFSAVLSPSDEVLPDGKATVGSRLARDLRSPDAATREGALAETAFHAHFGARNVDLSPTLPAVLKIYKSDADEQMRIMAVSVLNAIGDQDAMSKLYIYAKHERSPRVQMVTLAALQNHLAPAAFEGDREMGAMAADLLKWREGLKLKSLEIAAKN